MALNLIVFGKCLGSLIKVRKYEGDHIRNAVNLIGFYFVVFLGCYTSMDIEIHLNALI